MGISPECGTGFTLKPGDVHGWGESIGSYPEIKTSDTCAFLCSVIYAQDCCSYEWSPTDLKCNLNKECRTQTRTNHKDYLFCRRDNIKDLAGSQNNLLQETLQLKSVFAKFVLRKIGLINK